MATVLAFVLAAGLAALAIPAFARFARGWGLVDAPGVRKRHEGEVPLVGGLAMGVSMLATTLLASGLAGAPVGATPALAAALGMTLSLGLLDDRLELGSAAKFGVQIAAATMVVATGDAVLGHLGRLMSGEVFTLGRWALPLSVFALVGVMNAFNMADGLDGLAGGYALGACLNFAAAASLAGLEPEFGMLCVAAGALVGFLAFNARTPWRERALVFMGDAGSLLLGLLLGWIAVRLAMAPTPALAPIAAVWILALPIGDTVVLMTRRTLHRRSPFSGDRQHLHHILVAAGLSDGKAALVLVLLSFGLGAAAFTASRNGIAEHHLFYGYVVLLIAWGVASETLCRRLGLIARQPQR